MIQLNEVHFRAEVILPAISPPHENRASSKSTWVCVANWKWPGVLIAFVVAIVAMFYLYTAYWRFGSRFENGGAALRFSTLLLPIAAMLVPLLFLHFADRYLAVRSTPIEVIRFVGYAVAILASIFVVFAAANRFAELLIAVRQRKNPGLDALIQITAKLVAVILTLVLKSPGLLIQRAFRWFW